MKDKVLSEIREKLKEHDRELLRLLNARASLSEEIGKIKRSCGIEVYDPSQESRVLEYISSMNEGPLADRALVNIYREIFSASRAMQEQMAVAFLGPEGSFSHMAVQNQFGGGVKLSPQETIAGVFDAVERGRASVGLVPIENSLEGSVKATLDRLIATPLKIRAEAFLRVSHCLVSACADLSKVEKVYSHPQGLAQCRQWLGLNLPGVPLFEASSTAAAARIAAAEPGSAAIASRVAAEKFGIAVLASEIEDFALNTTRFLVMGSGKTIKSGRDKTSVLMGSAHIPGALHKALGPFAAEGLNLLRIESYPIRERNWEYLFFLDFEGHAGEKGPAECLRKMEQFTTFIKVLGSYPRGEEP
jgi:chorismate mutase/prephenate dehydratase